MVNWGFLSHSKTYTNTASVQNPFNLIAAPKPPTSDRNFEVTIGWLPKKFWQTWTLLATQPCNLNPGRWCYGNPDTHHWNASSSYCRVWLTRSLDQLSYVPVAADPRVPQVSSQDQQGLASQNLGFCGIGRTVSCDALSFRNAPSPSAADQTEVGGEFELPGVTILTYYLPFLWFIKKGTFISILWSLGQHGGKGRKICMEIFLSLADLLRD